MSTDDVRNEDWLRTTTWDVTRPDGHPVATLTELAGVLGCDPVAAATKVLTLPFGEAAPETIKQEAQAIMGTKAEGGIDKNRGGAEKLRRYWVHGEGAAKINWGVPGDFMRCVTLVSEHMDPERAKGYCNLRHQDALGVAPGQEKIDEADLEVKRKFSTAERDRRASSGSALPDGSFPISNREDLRNAISAYGRAKDKDKAKAHIVSRARALNAVGMLPDGWGVEKSIVTPTEMKTLDEYKAWLEQLHPRLGEGTGGGRFKPKGSGGAKPSPDVGKEGVVDRLEMDDDDRKALKALIDDLTGGGNRQDLPPAQRAAIRKMVDRLVEPATRDSDAPAVRPFQDESDENRATMRDMVDRMTNDGRYRDLSDRAKAAIRRMRDALGDKAKATSSDDKPKPRDRKKGLSFVDGRGVLQYKTAGTTSNRIPDGVFVGLYVPPDLAAKYAMDGGTPPGEMHVPLAYLGKADDVGDPAGLHTAIAGLAASSPPVQGRVAGVGRSTGGEEGDAVYLAVESSDLPTLRDALIAAIGEAGYQVESDDTSRVTLGHVPATEATPVWADEPASTEFGLLSVAYGPDVWDYPMGAPV